MTETIVQQEDDDGVFVTIAELSGDLDEFTPPPFGDPISFNVSFIDVDAIQRKEERRRKALVLRTVHRILAGDHPSVRVIDSNGELMFVGYARCIAVDQHIVTVTCVPSASQV